ncbi:MAG: hypothetical protein IKR47_03680 [Lachnospiraceae bacterium]|nr:hypothetical protein [Lachnospiraceae bacterium]MCR4684534.1 hypothetical protein [Lachnospiraceae bacterium]
MDQKEASTHTTYFAFSMGKFSGDFNKLEVEIKDTDSKGKYLVREKIVDTVPLTKDACVKFLNKVFASGILNWEEDYRSKAPDPNGRSWGVEVRFDNGEEVYKGGCDQYPDSWRKFIKAVNALKLPDIK